MRKTVGIVGLALAVGLGFATANAPVAKATSAGVSFSADKVSTWTTDGIVWALGQAQGNVLAGGTFTQIRPPAGSTAVAKSSPGLAVFDAETGAPTDCQFPLVGQNGANPSVRAITTSPDGGTVYIGGSFSSIKGVPAANIAAVNPVTCAVLPLRVSSISSVYALAAKADTLYIGGAFTTVSGQARQRFAAVSTATGALLPWIADADLPGRAITISPDGTKVALGGDFFKVNGADSHALVVVSASTGANVRTYPLGFVESASVTKALTSDATGFYAGNEGSGFGVFDGTFKIDWTTLNQVWRNTCLGATQAIVEYRGTLYEGSHHHDCSSVNGFQNGRRIYFTAESAADRTMLGWLPEANDGIGEGLGPRALVVAPGRTTGKTYLWVGGEFTTINGTAQQSLTRFGPDDVGAPPTPSPVAQAMTTGSVQVRWRTVVDPDDSRLTYRIYRNGSASPIWTGTSDSQWWTKPQVTYVDTTVAAGSTYTYRVSATDAAGNASPLSSSVSARAVAAKTDYAARVIKDGAGLYWRYDEASGAWAQDRSGSATNTAALNGLYEKGVTRGAAGAIVGDVSTAATFDGSDDYLWNDQLRPAPAVYSVESWFKTASTTGGLIVGYGNGRPTTSTGATQLSTNHDRQIYMDNAGHVAFGVVSGTPKAVLSTKAYNDSRWHHVVATQGSAGMALYVDGTRVAANAAITTAKSYTGVWHVGGDSLDGGFPSKPTSRFFKGDIDETAVYLKVLTATQVAAQYQLAGR